jgi:hypothetical protein
VRERIGVRLGQHTPAIVPNKEADVLIPPTTPRGELTGDTVDRPAHLLTLVAG